MNPTSLQDLLHLGGHGLYVWGAYGCTLGALALEAVWVRGRQRRAQQDARQAAGQAAAHPADAA